MLTARCCPSSLMFLLQAYFAANGFPISGWWTLVLYDKDTVVPFAGQDPTIPNPPAPAPGQLVFKRYSIE